MYENLLKYCIVDWAAGMGQPALLLNSKSLLIFLTLPCNTSRLGFTRYNSYWWEDLTEDGLGLCWQTQIFTF